MAQAGVAMMHDNSLAATLGGGRLSPSPWSRFLSPSLFSQRSATPTQTQPASGSPLKESITITSQAYQPGQFTHAREINPFERSFAVLDGPPAIQQGGADGGSALAAAGLYKGGTPSLAPAHSSLKRKRALSSPAVFTPGGSVQHQLLNGDHADADEVDDDMRAFLQAKRPALRFAADKDSGIGLTDVYTATIDMVPSESTYSLRSRGSSSGHNSFDSTTGTSLLGRRRALSASDSPDTSVTPSPPSPKLGGIDHAQFGPIGSSTFTHFQPQPLAFTMPPSTTTMPYGDLSVPAMTTFGPASVAPHAVAPLSFASDPQPYDALTMPLDPITSFEAYPSTSQAYVPVPVNPISIGAPLPPGVAQPIPHPGVVLGTAAGLAPITIAHSHLPPIPASTRQPPTLPLRAPAFVGPTPAAAPVAVPAAPVVRTAHKANKKAPPPADSPDKQLDHDLVPGSDEAVDHDSAEAGPTRPPGKKRGRKPKNWDPALEATIELDPEEQEKQRKLALERNRIAASKSRRRKKERVELLETASTDLCTRNLALQAECRNLFTEVHALRTMLAQAHPETACQCPHIVGYVVREREGGGIPAILYGAGGTIDRDYSRPPRWGTEDDVFAGTVEAQALDAIANGGTSLTNLVGGRRDYPRATSSIRSDTPGPPSLYHNPHPQVHVQVAPTPVVSAPARATAVGPQIPLKPPPPSTTVKSPAKKAIGAGPAQPHMTRRASAAAVAASNEGGPDVELEESETETVTLKSRRARAISTRTKE